MLLRGVGSRGGGSGWGGGEGTVLAHLRGGNADEEPDEAGNVASAAQRLLLGLTTGIGGGATIGTGGSSTTSGSGNTVKS